VLLIDIVQGALGPRVTPKYFFNRDLAFQRRVLDDVLDAYDATTSEPPAAKGNGEFRPVFVNDYIMLGDGVRPHDREKDFIEKAILYSDSVAVLDFLAKYSRSRREEGLLYTSDATMGYQDCPNAMAAIQRVVAYGELERIGLVKYVYATMARDYPREAEEVTPFRPDLAWRDQWLARSELFKALDVVGELSGSVDLYLPAWTHSQPELDWLLGQLHEGYLESAGSNVAAAAHRLRGRVLADAVTFDKMMRLPAPQIGEVWQLGPQALVDLHRSPYFERFRDDMRSIAAGALAIDWDKPREVAEAEVAVQRQMKEALDRLVGQAGNPRQTLRSAIGQGVVIGSVTAGTAVSAAAYSAGHGLPVEATTAIAAMGAAISAAPGLVQPLRDIWAWLHVDRSTLNTAKCCYRAFLHDL